MSSYSRGSLKPDRSNNVTVKRIIRIHPALRDGLTQWLVELVNGANALLTASELLQDLRQRAAK